VEGRIVSTLPSSRERLVVKGGLEKEACTARRHVTLQNAASYSSGVQERRREGKLWGWLTGGGTHKSPKFVAKKNGGRHSRTVRQGPGRRGSLGGEQKGQDFICQRRFRGAKRLEGADGVSPVPACLKGLRSKTMSFFQKIDNVQTLKKKKKGLRVRGGVGIVPTHFYKKRSFSRGETSGGGG